MVVKLASAVAITAAVVASASAEPIKLRFGHPASAKAHVVANFVVPWAAQVTKDSDGALQIDVFAGGQLGGNEVLLDSVTSGVADIGWVNVAYYSGKFDRMNVGTLPYEVDKSAPASAAMWKLYENGLFGSELADVKPLALFALPEAGIHSTFPVRRLEDLKGKRIASAGATAITVIEALGGIPAVVEFTDIYDAFNRRSVEGAVLQYTAMQPLRLWEVAKFHTDASLNGAVYIIAMNPASYAKLTPKAKEMLDRHAGSKWSREWGQFWDSVETSGKKLVEAAGPSQQFITLEPAEQRRWQDAAGRATEAWVTKTPNGADILTRFRSERDAATQ